MARSVDSNDFVMYNVSTCLLFLNVRKAFNRRKVEENYEKEYSYI